MPPTLYEDRDFIDVFNSIFQLGELKASQPTPSSSRDLETVEYAKSMTTAVLQGRLGTSGN